MSFILSYIVRVFSFDLRALSVFRIFLWFSLMIWLWDIFLSLEWLLQPWILECSLSSWSTGFISHTISIYRIFSEYAVWLAFFHFFLIVLFTVGYKTKIVTPLLWFMTYSLVWSNCLLYNATTFERLFSLLTLWSCFLPLSYSYSLDCFFKTWKFYHHRCEFSFSIINILFTFQLFSIYFISAFKRWDEITLWSNYLPSIIMNQIRWGNLYQFLKPFISIIDFWSFIIHYVELFWFLIFIIFGTFLFTRNLFLIILIFFHIFIWLFTDLFYISFIMITFLIAFFHFTQSKNTNVTVFKSHIFITVVIWWLLLIMSFNTLFSHPFLQKFNAYGFALHMVQNWWVFWAKHLHSVWYVVKYDKNWKLSSIFPGWIPWEYFDSLGRKHYAVEKQRALFKLASKNEQLRNSLLQYYCVHNKLSAWVLKFYRVWKTHDVDTGEYWPITSKIVAEYDCK